MNPEFIGYLIGLFEQSGSWWHSLVEADGVFVALRNHDAINAYLKGGSIARAQWNGGNPALRVHVQYLILPPNPANQPYINLLANNPPMNVAVAVNSVVYAENLEAIGRRIELLAPEERNAENLIACRRPCVLDMEAAFAGADADDADPEDGHDEGRIDLIAISEIGTLYSTELKLYKNRELRAGGIPAVCHQLATYHEFLGENQGQLIDIYNQRLVALRQLHGHYFDRYREAPDVQQISVIPNLLIVGFNQPQISHLDNQIIPHIVEHAQALIPGFGNGNVRRVGGAANVDCHHLLG